MSQNLYSAAPSAFRRRRLFPLLIVLLAVLLGLPGCEELSARRKVQEAGKLYLSGKYLEAAELYEQAAKVMPNNPVVLHNLALTYHKLFKPGLDTETNKRFANSATENFNRYLEFDPENQTIIKMMTGMWIDSGEWQKALEYWKHELEQDPTNAELIETVANIYRQAGEWEHAIEWYGRLAEAGKTPEDKAQAYVYIGRLTYNKLLNERHELYGAERLRVADMGIEAIQKAKQHRKDSSELASFLGGLHNLRAVAHGASWAGLADQASAQYYRKQFQMLHAKEAEAAQRAADEAARQAQEQANQDPAKPSGGS